LHRAHQLSHPVSTGEVRHDYQLPSEISTTLLREPLSGGAASQLSDGRHRVIGHWLADSYTGSSCSRSDAVAVAAASKPSLEAIVEEARVLYKREIGVALGGLDGVARTRVPNPVVPLSVRTSRDRSRSLRWRALAVVVDGVWAELGPADRRAPSGLRTAGPRSAWVRLAAWPRRVRWRRLARRPAAARARGGGRAAGRARGGRWRVRGTAGARPGTA